jgi:glycosyltransferase involved in cell wall biosynthesis
MKVLFATYPMAFHTPGGGEEQLHAYRRHLPKYDVTVTLMNPWKPRFLEHDLMHFFSCVGGSSHLCAFAKDRGLPLVVSSSLWISAETLANYPIDEIRHQLSLADRVVTNSDVEGDRLADILALPRDKFATVYNGVAESAFKSTRVGEFSRQFGIAEPFVLLVGNIEPRKNQVRLAEAMRDFPNHKLVLIGDARDHDYLEETLAAGGDQIRFIGPLPHGGASLRGAYRDCAVFALPSTLETPGLAALEAAAQNAELVLTSEGSAAEYFGDSAIYVDPGSSASIAIAIGQALDRRRRRQGDTPQLNIVRSQFTWSRVVGDLKNVYANALLR